MEKGKFFNLNDEDLVLLSKFKDYLRGYSKEFANKLIEKILSNEETKALVERSGVLKDNNRVSELIDRVSNFYLSIFSGDKDEIKERFLKIAKIHFKNLIPPSNVVSLSFFIVDFTIEKLKEGNVGIDEILKVSLSLNHILSGGVSLISYIFYKSLIKILGIRRELLIRLVKHGAEKLEKES